MPPRKPKPPVSEWIVSERKRLGWKVPDLSQKLLDLGYDAQIPTVQVWEAGRKPRDETIDGLERLFGSTAPRENGDASADVAAAIREQTAVLRELVEILRGTRVPAGAGPALRAALAAEEGHAAAERDAELEADPPASPPVVARRGRR